MDSFSENPRSFKLERRSPLASKLKDAIAEKLTEFLGNYTDDVLAEYIIVLVCNGKNQIQARDDLEAFLGERSDEFVSWLWNLLKYAHQSKPASADKKDINITSACDDVGKEQGASRLTDPSNNPFGNDSTLLRKNEKKCSLSSQTRNQVSISDVEDSQGFSSPLNEVYNKEVQALLNGNDIPKKSGKTEDNHTSALKNGSHRVRCSPGIPANDEQIIQDVDPYKKLRIMEQTANSNCIRFPQQLLYSRKKEPVSGDLQSFITENAYPGPLSVANVARTKLSSGVAGAVSQQTVKPRGNVWDRLGKPSEENASIRDETINAHNVDIIKKNILGHNGEGLDQNRLMFSAPDGRLNRRFVGEVSVLGNKRGAYISNINDWRKPENHATNVRRKRQFGEISLGPDSGSASLVKGKDMNLKVKDKETSNEFKRPSTVNCSHLRSLNAVVSESRKSDSQDADHVVRTEAATIQSQKTLTKEAKKISPNRTPVPICSPLVSKSESTSTFGTASLNCKPMESQVLDVKLRLREIEKEMSKLRSKQLEMNNNGKLNILSSSGVSNQPEEDIESRTVFVTNVHFAATKEALSLYFSKCGVVVKVIILTDIVTGQPKGSAYITFDSKASVDKAIALNGTSFFSRTVKVVRKAEMAAVIAAPTQLAAEKLPHPSSIPQKPYTSSHLQWRRESIQSV